MNFEAAGSISTPPERGASPSKAIPPQFVRFISFFTKSVDFNFTFNYCKADLTVYMLITAIRISNNNNNNNNNNT